MIAGLIILRLASERRDAQNERDEARATQLRRSSDSVAAPSQQHYNLALNCWSSHRRVPPRRAAASLCAQHHLRRSSISSVAAASAGDGASMSALVVNNRLPVTTSNPVTGR